MNNLSIQPNPNKTNFHFQKSVLAKIVSSEVFALLIVDHKY